MAFINSILLPVGIVAAIGLIAGLGLALASKFMAVPVDEKQEKIRECLPGANCGACGYSGCDGYAAAIANGEAEPNKCAPGGASAAAALAEVLGVEISAEEKVAFIGCGGTPDCTGTKYAYDGFKSCAAAALAAEGPNECSFGCIGFGDCMAACEFNAIEIVNGRPVICEDICKGCGRCATACPKGLISVLPKKAKVHVNCSNKAKGPAVVKVCKVSCIACGMCERACKKDAIHVVNNLAVIDYDKCVNCGLCKTACKRGVIV